MIALDEAGKGTVALLVICDIKMPGIGGLATIVELRAKVPGLPVIIENVRRLVVGDAS